MLQKLKTILTVFKLANRLECYKRCYLLLYLDTLSLRGCAIRLVNELEADGLKSKEAVELLAAAYAVTLPDTALSLDGTANRLTPRVTSVSNLA